VHTPFRRIFERGDSIHGRYIFQSKGCADCHEQRRKETGAPDLSQALETYSPITMTSAIWSHGPAMFQTIRQNRGFVAAVSGIGNGGPNCTPELAPSALHRAALKVTLSQPNRMKNESKRCRVAPKESFMKTLNVTVLVLALVVIVGCGSTFGQDAAAGKAVYSKKCQSCHAADGNGNANLANVMKVEFKPLSSDEVQKMSDADLKKIITDGMGKMKPVTGLMPAEVDSVAAFIRTFKKK
jgi:mono/diheme cytochrome c family protein